MIITLVTKHVHVTVADVLTYIEIIRYY